jgi:hypothetical protein
MQRRKLSRRWVQRREEGEAAKKTEQEEEEAEEEEEEKKKNEDEDEDVSGAEEGSWVGGRVNASGLGTNKQGKSALAWPGQVRRQGCKGALSY